eukprot:gene16857-23101_t
MEGNNSKTDTKIDINNNISRKISTKIPHSKASKEEIKNDYINLPTKVNFFEKQYLLWSSFLKSEYITISKNPQLIIYALCIFLILAAAGIVGVVFAGRSYAQSAKNLVSKGVAVEFGDLIGFLLDSASFGTKSLAAYITVNPNCTVLGPKFKNISIEIIKWNSAIYQLEIDVSGFVGFRRGFVYPPFPEKIDFLYNYDILRNQSDSEHYKPIIANKSVQFLGPYYQPDGFYGMYCVYPIFLPAVSYEQDLGCNQQPTNCSDVCWDETTNTKFYGLVESLVILDGLYYGNESSIKTLIQQDYHFSLKVGEMSINDSNYKYSDSLIYQHPKNLKLSDPVKHIISKYNLEWILLLEPAKGWTPRWQTPVIIGLTFVALVLATILLLLLISQEKQNNLLRLMLPRKVIKHLAMFDSVF